MGKVLSAAAGVGGGTGTLTVPNPAGQVVNNDDISSAVPGNAFTGSYTLTTFTPIDVVLACTETGHTNAGPSGRHEATEYGFTVTVLNLTGAALEDQHFELGWGTGGAFQPSTIGDEIDFDTIGVLGGPQLTPPPTCSKAGAGVTHGANLLRWAFALGARVAHGETVTYTFQLDLSDGYASSGGSPDQIPAGYRSGANFSLTLRVWATTPAVVPAPSLHPIAGCSLAILAPEPCAPACPPDPPGLTPEALEIRAAMTAALRGTPRTGPPFTAPAQWTSRGAAMPARGSEGPTGASVTFNGQLYVVYQGVYGNVGGTGPVGMYWNVGAIVRTADGVGWTTVFDGATPALPGAPYWMPMMLWVSGGTLYALVSATGWSWIAARAYLGPGEIAVMQTTTGTGWTKVQTLVSWAAAGAGETVGGTASHVALSGGHTQWRASGVDWLIVGYYAYANASTGAVIHQGTPQFRSLDGGETWTLVRDMKGSYPFTANPTTVDAPHGMVGVPRPGAPIDRWVMLGGIGGVNYSDDTGASWTASPADGGHTGPASAFVLPSGGMVFLLPGTGAFGPGEQISCNYGASRQLIATSGFGGGANTMVGVLQFGAGTAGGEELLAVTKRGGSAATIVWHTTNGGETWAERGDVPTGFMVSYSLGRIGTGRVVLYLTGGGATTEVWTCDDAPTGVPTPRTLCPFVVSIFPPMGQIAGCASLTFVTELCGALGAPPLGPGADTCLAPLGLFVLGETCLGAPGLVPRQSTRARSLPHAR